MAGSIRPRPEKGRNVYELRIFVGRDARGRVRQKSKLFRGTRRAAEMELARLVTENVDEPVVVPQESARAFGPSTTINMAIKAWKDNGWQDLSPSTTLRYASIWTTHIKDSIGRRKIATLGPYDVELYLRRLKSEGLSEVERAPNPSDPASILPAGAEVERQRPAQSGFRAPRCRTGCSTSSPMRCGHPAQGSAFAPCRLPGVRGTGPRVRRRCRLHRHAAR